MVEAFLLYWLSWYIMLSSLEDCLNLYVFSLAILNEGGAICVGSIVSWLTVCTIGRVYGECGTSSGEV